MGFVILGVTVVSNIAELEYVLKKRMKGKHSFAYSNMKVVV